MCLAIHQVSGNGNCGNWERVSPPRKIEFITEVAKRKNNLNLSKLPKLHYNGLNYAI